MLAIQGRWRLFGALVLLVATIPVFTMVSGPRPEQVLAQSSGDLRVSYPVDDSHITGDTIPVVWGAGDGDQVALILDEAVDPAGGDAIEAGDGVVIATESPALITDVEPGEHTVGVVVVDGDGVPVDGGDVVTADVTVLAAQTAAIYPGVCSGIGADASYDSERRRGRDRRGSNPGWSTRRLTPSRPGRPVCRSRSSGRSATRRSMSRSPICWRGAQVISVSGAGIDGLDDGDSAACGEVGGVVAGGILNVGLRQQPNSPLFGIASLIDLGDSTRVVVESALTDEAAPEDTEVIDEGEAPVELPVSLQQGICDSLNPDVSTDLDTTTELQGETEGAGVAFATRVLVSETTIDQPVTDLLARAASIAVAASGLDGIEDGDLVACGEVGGPLLSGVARVALTERDGSGVQGMATLFAQGESTTILIELFRVGGSNAEAEPSPSASASASPDEESDLDDDGVADDVDNCLTEPNADQADADGDGIGDACTEVIVPAADADEDGVPDSTDNCTFVANPGPDRLGWQRHRGTPATRWSCRSRRPPLPRQFPHSDHCPAASDGYYRAAASDCDDRTTLSERPPIEIPSEPPVPTVAG